MSIPPASRVADRLDFANPGVWLKLLLAANGVLAIAVAFVAPTPSSFTAIFASHAAWAEPVLLATLVMLAVFSRFVPQAPWPAFLAAGASAAAMSTVAVLVWAPWPEAPATGRTAWLAALVALAILHGFELDRRSRRPALAEARLAALSARIRPHFLFNSLNAALGVLREDPARAEAVLEALAELFRAALREPGEHVPLSAEIDLARRYLDIERLRLAERLRVEWEIPACPPEARVPPFLLQPLLENAVYHGIEPSPTGGAIRVVIRPSKEELFIEIDNPLPENARERPGNRLALANLRERLALFYDLAARVETEIRDGSFRVCMRLPLRK